MTDNRIPVQFSDRSRRWADRLTRRIVTASGVAILLLMLLLFFWLIWVVVPLFAAPGLQAGATQPLTDKTPSLALGMQGDAGWRISRAGTVRFIPLDGAPPEPVLPLAQAPEAVVTSADQRSLLIQSRGTLLLLQPARLNGETEWRFPLGDKPLMLPEGPAQQLALATPDENRWRIAATTPGGVTVTTLTRQREVKHQRLNQAHADLLLLSPRGDLLYSVEGRLLRVWELSTEQARLREVITLTKRPRSLHLLAGGQSLLIEDDDSISQWFAIAGEQGVRLQNIQRWPQPQGERLIVTEPNRRVFATLMPTGLLQLYASKQPGPILSRQLAPGIRHARFSDRGDRLLVERESSWQSYHLDNPWPDFSWRNLWQKVWYENYPQPDWVWQSTAAGDNYQAKFSLVPMVIGTLKAAALALLFATPLALAAAIYTAWFMAPGLRRWVKPAIEMMGALPSVVIGLIAGLWLAPRISSALSGVLLLPLMLALTLLICGALSARLPASWRQPGREILLLLPLLSGVTLLTLWLLPQLTGDLSEHLQHYEQRNLLVAGVAMGFALVPLIFTLAEDALFSVPAALGQGSLALGATPWQTLTRVILPGASAGIFAALMIGFGRAVGETMIVLMATGNTPVTDGGLFSGLRALAANIAIEMPEAAAGSAHYRILFLSALLLLIFTLVINTLAEVVRQRLRQRYSQHEGQG